MMTFTLDLDELQQDAASAVISYATRDEHGVLGLPVSRDGLSWGQHWPVSTIVERIDEAVAIVWVGESLRVSGRHEADTVHFRLPNPGYPFGSAYEAYARLSQVIGHRMRLVWEVTDPAGTVLVRSHLELADEIYQHAPTGSHLRQVVAAAGHLEQRVVTA